jgi:DNA polymerase-3 subunit delta
VADRLGLSLFHGGETYLVDRAFESAWGRFAAAAASELDIELMDDGATPAEVLGAASAVGFFAPGRVVGVRDWRALVGRSGRRPKNQDDDPQAAAARALAEVPESAQVVIGVRSALPATHPVVKLARERGQVQEFPKLRFGELQGWTQRRAREIGLRIDGRALQLLVNRVGDDLRIVDQELAKLDLHAGGGTISVEDVRVLVPDTAEHQVWDLTDALLARPGKALLELDRALDAGDPAGRLSFMLVRHLRLLLAASDAGRRGGAPALVEAMSKDGRPLSDYTVRKALEQAAQVDPAKVERLYRRAAELEAASRRGELDEEAGLRLLVMSASA